MKKVQQDVGVIVGRFQVDELHEAHVDLIRTVRDNHNKVLIFLGLSPVKCTINNPLDFESRKQMIEENFQGITVLYIKDTEGDTEWSRRLDEQIKDVIGPGQSVMLYGSRSSFINHYNGEFPCTELEQTSFVSGSQIRKNISTKVKSSPEFRAGVIWCTMNQFVNAVPTVDIAIEDTTARRALFGRKRNEERYRLIGGFVNPGETYEEAAIRETKEEAGLKFDRVNYISSYIVDDWRFRSEKHKITTALFKAQYKEGTPAPGDDIYELRWFELKGSVLVEYISDIHIPLVRLAWPNLF